MWQQCLAYYNLNCNTQISNMAPMISTPWFSFLVILHGKKKGFSRDNWSHLSVNLREIIWVGLTITWPLSHQSLLWLVAVKEVQEIWTTGGTWCEGNYLLLGWRGPKNSDLKAASRNREGSPAESQQDKAGFSPRTSRSWILPTT